MHILLGGAALLERGAFFRFCLSGVAARALEGHCQGSLAAFVFLDAVVVVLVVYAVSVLVIVVVVVGIVVVGVVVIVVGVDIVVVVGVGIVIAADAGVSGQACHKT